MFGLWFSIIGLIFGILCSYKAKEKNRAQKEWFLLGFIFSFFAFGVMYLTPKKEIIAEENTLSVSHDDIPFSATV